MVAALVACADATPFARYQTIIDRKPFGPEPVNFDPEAAPGSATAQSAQADGEMTPEQRTAEEQQLAASVRVSMINVRPSGDVAVGFTDTSANPQANYYLTVGRSQDGWTVKSADPATESVTLAKDGIEVTVKLGENAGGKGGKGGNAANASRRMMPPRMFQPGAAEGRGPGVMPPGMAGGAANGGNESMPPRAIGGLARLRQQRQEQMARAAEEAQRKREADDAAKAERQEREAREAEEKQREAEQKQREAEERAQQREALLQIQEQLKRAREEREAAKREQQEGQGEANDPE